MQSAQLHTAISAARELQNAISAITGKWPAGIFESGHCHTLAMAIHEASAPAASPELRSGELWACIRTGVDEDGQVVTTTYAHMVYTPDDGSNWDVGGPEADERWAENYDLDSRDKWGLQTELAWVQVPCQDPKYLDTHAWLTANFGLIDTELQGHLVAVIRESQI